MDTTIIMDIAIFNWPLPTKIKMYVFIVFSTEFYIIIPPDLI